MNITRKLLLVLVLIAACAALVTPAFAQESKSVTVTEEDINAAYRVTNPPRRTFTNVVVDLQVGQVVVNATFTVRGKDPVDVSGTLVPSVSNGRLFWTATAASADGVAVSDDLLRQINSSISSAWRNYIRQTGISGRVTAIDITEDSLTISYISR
jgi:hypothetical protein